MRYFRWNKSQQINRQAPPDAIGGPLLPTRDFFRSLSRCHHGSCHLRWTRSSPFSAVAILAQGVGDLPSALEATSQKEKAYIRFASALQMPSMRQASQTLHKCITRHSIQQALHTFHIRITNALDAASVTHAPHLHYTCTRFGKRYIRFTFALHMQCAGCI